MHQDYSLQLIKIQWYEIECITYFPIHTHKHIPWLQLPISWPTWHLKKFMILGIIKIVLWQSSIEKHKNVLTTESTTNIPVSPGAEACRTIYTRQQNEPPAIILNNSMRGRNTCSVSFRRPSRRVSSNPLWRNVTYIMNS